MGRRHRSAFVLAALAPGLFLAFADATAMSVAVPIVIRDLGSSVLSVSWVMNGYNLVLTVLYLTMGRLGDRHGHRRLFAAGLALFTLASLFCARADGVGALVAWRVVQAVGAAALVPAGLALVLAAFPGSRQGLAAGLFGAVSSAAAAAGPALAGLLVGRWGWPAVFWFNLPLGAAGVAAALALVPATARRRPAALDWPGVGLVTGGLFCLTLALIQGNEWGWSSAAVVALLAAAAVLLLAWARWELRVPVPLFDLRLFGARTFAAASAVMVTIDTAMMGTSFMLVIFMVAMMDFPELRAGLTIAVLPAAGLALTPLAGALSDRWGPRRLAVAGSLLTAAGLVALAFLSRHAPEADVLWRAGLVGVGLGLTLPAVTAAGMGAVPGGHEGAGSGMLSTARQLGFLLGVAVLVAVFAHTMTAAVNRAADEGQALTRAQPGLGAPLRARLVAALDQARTIDATAGMGELRRIAHPIAADIGAQASLGERLVLLGLKDRLENLLWDEVAGAFRWPFLTAALAAALGAAASAALPGRRRRAAAGERPADRPG